MTLSSNRSRVGIVGCGAIGSRMAKGIVRDFPSACKVTGLFDIDPARAQQLEKVLFLKKVVRLSLSDLIKSCDFMVEAVSAQTTRSIVRQALCAKKSVLSMSVGKLRNFSDLASLARKNRCHLLIPSGAIAGIDAVKAAGLAGIDQMTLTSRKPPTGFLNNPYLTKKGIDPLKIRRETVLFEGSVRDAVRCFPQNINVAATLSLAAGRAKKTTVRILTSPRYTSNRHEVEFSGKFGKIMTRTDNVVCPDNPKTSYLAVLSGLQALKQYCMGVYIGT